jgi:hypothetical protein
VVFTRDEADLCHRIVALLLVVELGRVDAGGIGSAATNSRWVFQTSVDVTLSLTPTHIYAVTLAPHYSSGHSRNMPLLRIGHTGDNIMAQFNTWRVQPTDVIITRLHTAKSKVGHYMQQPAQSDSTRQQLTIQIVARFTEPSWLYIVRLGPGAQPLVDVAPLTVASCQAVLPPSAQARHSGPTDKQSCHTHSIASLARTL